MELLLLPPSSQPGPVSGRDQHPALPHRAQAWAVLGEGQLPPAPPAPHVLILPLPPPFTLPSLLTLGHLFYLSLCLSHCLFCFSFSSLSSSRPGTPSSSLSIFIHLSVWLLLSVFLSFLISLPHHPTLTPALLSVSVSLSLWLSCPPPCPPPRSPHP